MFLNPQNISFVVSRNAKGEHSCFSSIPLYDSSDHDDVDEHIKLFYCGFCDLFAPSFDHNVDSFTDDISKPPIFDDLRLHEVENQQVIKALQLEMMVMSGPHCLEVDSTEDYNFLKKIKAPHYSPIYNEYQSIS